MTVKERIRLVLLSEKIQNHPEFQNIISVSLVPTILKEEAGDLVEKGRPASLQKSTSTAFSEGFCTN